MLALSAATNYPFNGSLDGIRIFHGYVRDYFTRSDSYVVWDAEKFRPVEATALHPYGTTGRNMGARAISGGYPPQTPVLLAKMGDLCYILGVIPQAATNLKDALPGYMVMRSNAGAADLKAPMHYEALKLEHGYPYRPLGRPLDALGGDWGYTNEFGLAFFLGKMMASMRASDMAKVEAFWGDDLLRIFGYNLQIYTAVREEYEVSDEGEGNLVRRSSPFAWEAIGAKNVKEDAVDLIGEKGGGDAGRARDPQHRAWWEPKKKDQLIIPRHTLMRGYMGDLEHEWISVPGKSMPDQELFDNSTKHVGVFEQIKNITGAYLIRSAKDLTFEKSILIPVPKELKAPDDPTGDNRDNYHAAGSEELGKGGQTPELKEYEYPEKSDANGWFSYLYDVQAWMYNRVVIGGLYLHTKEFDGKDWYLPAESDLKEEFNGSVESVNIKPEKLNIGNKFMVDLPEIAKLKVDHRKGHDAVRYYQSRSIFKMQEDGSVLIEDGYGSSIQMKGGSIFLACVGDVFMQPGRSIINWAPRDFIAKAGNCVDITSSENDIHIKAEKNLEFISGNGSDGNGAMVFDCRSKGKPAKADFTEIGEDRKTKGIIFKAADSPIYMFGDDCYVGLSKATGRVTLDGKDGGEVYLRGKEVKNRTDEFNVIGRNGGKSLLSIVGSQAFWNTASNYMNGAFYVVGSTMLGEYVEVQGFLNCTTGVYAKNGFASERGGLVGDGPAIPPQLPTPKEVQKVVEETYEDVKKATDEDEQAVVKETDAPGNEKFQARVHFSCRSTKQYFGGQQGTFFLWETKWQTLLKQGGGSAIPWNEPEVPRTGSGDPEMPHPGIDAWKEQDKFKYIETPDNYEAKTGIAKSRKSLTEEGKKPKEAKLMAQYIVTTQK